VGGALSNGHPGSDPATTLRLGPLELASRVLAAPIAGFTDFFFRAAVRHFGGSGLLFTEMVSAGGWIEGSMPPTRLWGVEREPRPLGVQLWDREPRMIEEAARRLADLDVSVIDLNFGCPKRRIMGRHGAGATLLRDPETVGRLVAAAVRGAGKVPVTAKIRLGPSENALTAIEVARRVEGNGAAALTVHGRVAEEHYGVACRRDRIAAVVSAVSIPVIANGDVRDGPSALATVRETGAAGVMVARAALTRPWVFREIDAALRGEPEPPPPSLAEQRALLLSHHAALVEREGDEWGTVLMRKFAGTYAAGHGGARAFRDALNRARNAAEFRAAVEEQFPA
jgi:tRNA-dihydrouridine synthase B